MITRQRIRELLSQHGLAHMQLDALAAYCATVQAELTEQDVHALAEHIKKKV